jgi:hypothetical protein
MQTLEYSSSTFFDSPFPQLHFNAAGLNASRCCRQKGGR